MNSLNLSARIRLVARIVRWLALVTMALIVANMGYVLINHAFGLVWAAETKTMSISATIAPPMRALAIDSGLAAWLEIIPEGVLFWGLFRLTQMMRACEQNEFFSYSVADHLQNFSFSAFLAEVLYITVPIQTALLHSVMTHAPFKGTLVITGDQTWALFLALVFLVLSWMLREAALVSEDSQSII